MELLRVMKSVGFRLCVIFIVVAFLPISQAGIDAQSENWEIRIDYSGEWRALVESDNSDRRGYGSETITTYAASESATVRKLDDNSKEMCVELWKNGELVDTACTSSGYGEVEVGKCKTNCGDPSVPFSEVPGFEAIYSLISIAIALFVIARKRTYGIRFQ